MGMAVYVPMTTKKREAYSMCVLWSAARRMVVPTKARRVGIKANRKRWAVASESAAVRRAKKKAAALGGTECSWVSMGV